VFESRPPHVFTAYDNYFLVPVEAAGLRSAVSPVSIPHAAYEMRSKNFEVAIHCKTKK
jgi:hypothetical protein